MVDEKEIMRILCDALDSIAPSVYLFRHFKSVPIVDVYEQEDESELFRFIGPHDANELLNLIYQNITK